MAPPSRPLPASVYWRRRLVVLGGLLAVIAVIVLIIVRPGFGVGGAAPEPEEPLAEETTVVVACMPSQLELRAQTDQVRYDSGVAPQLWLTVKNVSAVECSVQVGTDVQRYVISSGPDQIWASEDCQTSRVPYELVLAPGEEQSTEALAWDRTRSSPDTCESPTRPVMPGGGASYHLSVFLGDLQSAETRQFLLN